MRQLLKIASGTRGDVAPTDSRPKKIVFCWANVAGYMAACWRQLQTYRDVDVAVVARAPDAAHNNAPFSSDLLDGVDARLLRREDGHDWRIIREEVERQRPDVLAISGWDNPAYRRLRSLRALRDTRFVLVMDTQWTGSLRQRLGRFRHPGFFRRIDNVAVAGDRGRTMARALGFRDPSILVGAVYGADHERLRGAHVQRSAAARWPRAFLFVGQLVRRKGLDVLLRAYTDYRTAVDDPWELIVCGQGPLQSAVEATPGVRFMGFVQPRDLVPVLATGGAFVLPSNTEPWGMTIVEACSAGLPVICTRACGASVELVHNDFNGWVLSHTSASLIQRALHSAHASHDRLPRMGRRSHELATAHSAEAWASRWVRLAQAQVGGA